MNLARKEQLPPEGDWNIWLYMAGRGAGKTRTAAEWLAWEAIENPDTRWAIVAQDHHYSVVTSPMARSNGDRRFDGAHRSDAKYRK